MGSNRRGRAGASGAISAAACAANRQNGHWSSQQPPGACGAPLSSEWTQSAAASPKVASSWAEIAAVSGETTTGAESAW